MRRWWKKQTRTIRPNKMVCIVCGKNAVSMSTHYDSIVVHEASGRRTTIQGSGEVKYGPCGCTAALSPPSPAWLTLGDDPAAWERSYIDEGA